MLLRVSCELLELDLEPEPTHRECIRVVFVGAFMQSFKVAEKHVSA